MKTKIFTISATNLKTEEEVYDVLAMVDYFSGEAAIAAARELAEKCNTSYDEVCNVTVFAGEYKTESGDILGEPMDIYTISSKSKEVTIEARKRVGYASLEVDEYID